MEGQLESLPFEEWVAHVFDHDVRDPQWYFDSDAPFWAAPAHLTLTHVTRFMALGTGNIATPTGSAKSLVAP